MSTLGMVIGLGAAYLLGCIPTGYWIVKARKGIDIRQIGSGNIGATNVARALGRPWAIGVLIFDIAKGTVAVLLGQLVFFSPDSAFSLDLYKILCAIAAVCGHNWTVFLGFKGGKGVATSAGALLGVAPLLLLWSAAVWAIAAKIFRTISMASMVAGLGFCVLTFLFETSFEMKVFGIVMLAMLVFRHRANIKRLLNGTEPKIGQRK